MKLESHHIAPYLPYGLKVQTEHIEANRVYTLTGLSAKYDRVDLDDDYGWSYIGGIKPILHPLSDFRDKIIRDIKIELDCSINQVTELFCLIDGSIRLQDITLGLYTVLCKNHVDFNNLIENNLAIDINTLK